MKRLLVADPSALRTETLVSAIVHVLDGRSSKRVYLPVIGADYCFCTMTRSGDPRLDMSFPDCFVEHMARPVALPPDETVWSVTPISVTLPYIGSLGCTNERAWSSGTLQHPALAGDTLS